MNELMNKWMNNGIMECTNELKNVCMYEWLNKWMKKGIN